MRESNELACGDSSRPGNGHDCAGHQFIVLFAREAIGDSESSPCRVGIPVTWRPEGEAVFPTRREWVKHAAHGCTKRDLCYDANLPSWIDFASVAHPPLGRYRADGQ